MNGKKAVLHALLYVGTLAAYTLAAALAGVEATVSGTVLIAFVTAVVLDIYGTAFTRFVRRYVATNEPSQRGCITVYLLALSTMLLPIPLVPAAAAVTPGYDISGLGAHAAAVAFVVAMQLVVEATTGVLSRANGA